MNATKSLMIAGLCALWTAPLYAQTFPSLLAPADPKHVGQSPRYAPVTAGLKRFGVVEPKDWVKLNQAVGPQAGHEPAMPGMPGMAKPGAPTDGGKR